MKKVKDIIKSSCNAFWLLVLIVSPIVILGTAGAVDAGNIGFGQATLQCVVSAIAIYISVIRLSKSNKGD